jgi:predicted  nucleic acid-binding Zn-ribbon protein
MLENYTCTKCFTHPVEEKEIFNGCAICGNKLFRLEDQTEKKFLVSKTDSKSYQKLHDEFTSIQVEDSGVYHLNIEKLFKESKKQPLLVSEKEGVYFIKF